MDGYMRGIFIAALGIGYRVVMSGEYSKEAIKNNFNPIAFAAPILVNEALVGKIIKPESDETKVEKCKLTTGVLAVAAAYLLWMNGAENFIVEVAYLAYIGFESLKEARITKLLKKK